MDGRSRAWRWLTRNSRTRSGVRGLTQLSPTAGDWRLSKLTVVKSLWASIQGDPKFMRRVNGWLTMFWVAMIPVSYELGWLKSVVYVSALSLWALVAGHWSSWQAARVEVAQEEEARKREAQPPEEKVVDKLIERTSITAAEGSES
jgi:hypothetical protein